MNLERFDHWIGKVTGDAWTGFKNGWSSYSTFFARFHVSGFKRVLAEIFSEGATLGTAGVAVLFVFATPAFEETDEAWRSLGNYSVTFLDRYGNEIGQRGILQSDAVPLEEIPDHMIKTALATEDRRFFDHFGIDVIGTFRAILENVRASTVVQGGSSITQQLAKNLFLTPEKSLKRKIKEAYLALWLEARLSKNEILKLYFDRAYMGGGAFGLEAAAQYYFGKSIRDVTLSEAAMLAGLFKAPTKYAPHNNLPAARARANEVLTNLVQAGFMTEGQVHAARLNPAKVKERPDHYSPDYFLDWAFEETQRLMEGKRQFILTVRTTLDVSLQKKAEEAVTTQLRQNRRVKKVRQAAMVAMETDGAVRVIVGGPDYGESQFNRATQSKRQPGSSFKPYVYLTALENGYRPSSSVVDSPVSCGRKSFKNYTGRYRGRMNMATALAKSINTVAVKLSLRVGRDKVLANTRKLGLKGVRRSCSMALGDTGMPVLDHTAAFVVFANGGMSVEPYGIEEIRSSSGELIYSREQIPYKPVRLFKRKHIESLNRMLGQVVTAGTGRRAELDFTTAAGKTGTSSNYRDAWFMGFTGKYVAGVWFGNDSYQPMNRVTGGSLPAMTWKQFMQFAHATPDIPQIPGLKLHPNQVKEMQRLAAAKKADPSLGGNTARGRGLSKQTRKVLKRITQMMRSALKPDKAAETKGAEKRAALAPDTLKAR